MKTDTSFLSRSSFLIPNRLVEPYYWVSHIPFAFWLIENHRPQILVELGTEGGNSYMSFCQAIVYNNLDTKTYAIDTWKGDQHTGGYSEDIYLTLKNYNDRYYSGFSRLIRSTFNEAVNYFKDCSIDLLHIDGCHTYEAVKQDFETWLPKLSSRAIVLFHDSNVRENNFGVYKFWDEIKDRYLSFEFLHGSGLGVLGVGKEISSVLNELLIAGNNEEETFLIREQYCRLGEGVLNSALLKLITEERENLTQMIRRNNEDIAELNSKINASDSYIHEITHSVVWKVINLVKIIKNHFNLMLNVTFSLLKKVAKKTIFFCRVLIIRKSLKKFKKDIKELNKGDTYTFTLIFDHSLGGGANKFIETWIKEQGGGKVLLLRFVPFFNMYNLTYYDHNFVREYKFYNHKEIYDLWSYINIGRVVINDLVSYPSPLYILRLLSEIKEKNNPKFIYFVNDYHAVCPNFRLFGLGNEYCGIPEQRVCDECLKRVLLSPIVFEHKILFANDFVSLPFWREQWGYFLNQVVDDIICFSNNSKNILLKIYPESQEKIKVIPHKVTAITPLKIIPTNNEVVIGILGNIFGEPKGAAILRNMAELIENKNIHGVKLVVIGDIAAKYRHKKIYVTGKYNNAAELSKLIVDTAVNIAFIPSLCPETFSYTTEEAILMGLPVAVFDVGAPFERVKAYDKGLVLTCRDPAEIIYQIVNFVQTLNK